LALASAIVSTSALPNPISVTRLVSGFVNLKIQRRVCPFGET
jgi:hypothetical protein